MRARGAFADYHIKFYCCPVNKHRTKGRRSQGAKEYRRGCSPPAPDRREEPPVVVRQQKKPRRGDRVLICCLQSNWTFCRPFGAFVLLMFLYRGLTPPSVFFRAFGAFPRTTIIKFNVSSTKIQRTIKHKDTKSYAAEQTLFPPPLWGRAFLPPPKGGRGSWSFRESFVSLRHGELLSVFVTLCLFNT